MARSFGGTKRFKREEGFTIIEVLIVLAIAGLIILIVFLAVPALQRRSRNNQRTDDAVKFTTVFKECLTNNRAKGSECFGPQILNYVDLSKNLQLSELEIQDGTKTDALNRMLVHAGQQCNSQGNGIEPTVLTSKVFAVTYLVETSNSTATRCIEAAI